MISNSGTLSAPFPWFGGKSGACGHVWSAFGAVDNYVADAQQRGDLDKLGAAETQMRLGLDQLFAVAEAYPELRANDNFRHLETRITGLENAIADRREFYNDSVNLNNVRIELFPDVLIARLFAFGPFRLLEFTEPEKRDVNLAQLFR